MITVALWIVYNGKGYGFQVADHLMVLIGRDMVLVRLLLLLLLLGGLLCCRLQAVVVLLVLQHTTGAVKISPLERIEQAALLLLALLLEEQPNVVDREDDALAGRFFRVDVNAPHQHRVGAVQQDQQQQGGTVRYPVAEERIVWRVGRDKHTKKEKSFIVHLHPGLKWNCFVQLTGQKVCIERLPDTSPHVDCANEAEE